MPWLNGWAGTFAVCAPSRASELVRVTMPSRLLTRGRTPVSFMSCRSFWVPSVPAASTTCAAVRLVTGPFLPVGTLSTTQVPSGCSWIEVTVVSGSTTAPRCSARYR